MKNKRLTIYLIVIAAIILVVFVIQPVITSYFVLNRQQGEVQKEDTSKEELFRLNAEVSSLTDKYTECVKDKDSYKTKMEQYLDKSNICEGKLGTAEGRSFGCESDLENVKDDFEDCDNELENVKEDLDECKEGFDDEYSELVENSADTICCMQRFYDEDIDSYEVENNKIKCTKGGDNKISC